MNIEMYDGLYNSLNEYINENSKIRVAVLKKPNSNIFPKIVIEEIANAARGFSGSYMESYSDITYEINVYAKTQEVDGIVEDSMDIARYLQSLISEFMEYHFRAKRVFCSPTPNIDDNVYRITMRYTTQASDYRGHFF